MSAPAHPIAQFADPAQLEAGFAALPRGAGLIYAIGPSPLGSPGNPTVQLVQRWLREGKATIASGRDPGDREKWCYRVYRVVVEPAVPGGKPPLRDPNWEESPTGRVYRLLRRCAQRGWPCPTNEAIAEQLQFEGARQARYRFNQLEADGLIKVIEPARFSTRVIEITATGQRTAASDAQAAVRRLPIAPGKETGR